MICLDARTGEQIWRRADPETQPEPRLVSRPYRTETIRSDWGEIFGTWLGYSAEHDILLQCGRPAVCHRSWLRGEPDDRMIAYRASDGELLWERQFDSGLRYATRIASIIHHDSIIIQGRAICLLTGEDKTVSHPLTGEEVVWRFWGSSNCGQMIASENLLTFRRSVSGYYDMANHSGTTLVTGVRAGCTASMVPADGILSMPDYTRTCDCSYQLQTSIAMVPGELTVRVELVPEESRKQVRRYDVRLFFLEPEATAPGQRVFSVTLQGEPALENFDIFREAGGNMREIAREFKGVEVEDVLEIGLTAGGGMRPPLLCGVEFRLVE